MGERTTPAITYTYLWKKYRPAILNLMIASENEAQEYKFSSHEFRDLNPKKPSHSFTLRVHQSKAINDVKSSLVAKDLLQVLRNSERATELTNTAIYQFELDKKFVLHITHEAIPESEEPTQKEDEVSKVDNTQSE